MRHLRQQGLLLLLAGLFIVPLSFAQTSTKGIQYVTQGAKPCTAGATCMWADTATGDCRYYDGATSDTVALLGTAQTFTASQNVASVALSDGASIATNAALGNVFTVTLGGNRTLANPTNLVSGGVYRWAVQQDATGGRTLAYGSDFTWSGGVAPTLSVAAGAVDVISCTYYGGTSKLLCWFDSARGGPTYYTWDNLATSAQSNIIAQNTTSATALSTVQVSPAYAWKGTAWDTDDLVSRTITVRAYVRPSSATSTAAIMVWTQQIDNGAETEIFSYANGFLAGPLGFNTASRYFNVDQLSMVSNDGSANPQLGSGSANITVSSADGVHLTMGSHGLYQRNQNGGAGGCSLVTGILGTSGGSILTISSNTIAPTQTIHRVDAGLIKTITRPTLTGAFTNAYEGTIILIPTAAFTWDTTGNIAIAGTAVVGKALHFTYISATSTWYPSYI